MISTQDIDLILSSVDFSRLSGKRILITGGSGFIGHWLSIAPASVTVRTLNHIQYDYSNWDKQNWDWIIHLANVSPSRVIECAERCKAGILFASSGAVYDQDPGEYALDKIHSERLLLDCSCPVRIARMFTFTGAYMRNHFAVINYILDAIGGGPIRIRGDNVTRAYMYAADLAVWLWRILLDGVNGRAYDVGSERPVNMQHLADEVASNFTPNPQVVFSRIYGPDARPHYVPDTSLAQRDLGVKETVPFENAILKTIIHYWDEVNISKASNL